MPDLPDASFSDPRDYILEISGVAPEKPAAAEAGRPFLSVLFKCCGVYQRIYKTADGSAYAGHCPKCAAPVRAKIGPGGTSHRIFTAG